MKLRWATAVVWTALIVGLSVLPGESIKGPDFRFADKVAHFVMYAVMAALEGETDIRRSLVWEKERSVICGTRSRGQAPEGWEGGAFASADSTPTFRTRNLLVTSLTGIRGSEMNSAMARTGSIGMGFSGGSASGADQVRSTSA